LKLLHQAITVNYHSEDELFREYLAIGKKIFKLETGIISRIENNNYTVLAFSSPLEGLEVNQVFQLQDTYCREVFESEKTVAFPHVGAVERMCEHPVYVNMKLESYLSSPIFVKGEIYGTINFTDRTIRHQNFSTQQFELIEIMAKTIARFLESKLIKKELKEANDRINRLVGVVAHDLKNPLGNILSLAEMIEEETNEDETRETVQLLKLASTSSMEMVHSILDMSAIDAGKIKMLKSPNSFLKLIQESWSTVSHMAAKKSISFEMNGDDKVFDFDYQRMKQTFCNLFTNAIKFSYEGSSIKTSWFTKDDHIHISIEDTGVGISPELIVDIFDASKTTSTPGTNGELGTGYGLPLVAKIIKFHKGFIEAESEIDKGSIFKIALPLG
tara:strand:- start:2272 stop:3432 length:1161 start_codon:yes stop_codon:yes gene_type:complete